MTGAKQLLILDSHSSYLTADFDDFCKQNTIICLCIPAHASQLFQPLDIDIFGLFKLVYGKLLEKCIVADNNYIDKEDFLSLYPDIYAKIFISEKICSSFAEAEFKPFDQKRVLSKLNF